MTKKEKIINGLEHCRDLDIADMKWPPGTCPYYERGCCRYMNDAIALLRAQDQSNKPREERHEITINHVWGDDVEVWSEFYCPHCGAMIAKGNSEHYPRCMWCGGKIQWV